MSAAFSPCQLQVNQAGAWRTWFDFDASDMPDEVLQYTDQLLRLVGGEKITARVVMAKPNGDGRMVADASHRALMRWSRPNGWVNT